MSFSSPNFDERAHPIDMVVLHYTDMPLASEALKWMLNPKSQVSAHYLIDEEGEVIALVPEEKRAWHAGESYWQGRTSLNHCSLGIELANPGHSHGYLPFPEAQIAALIKLCSEIQERWNIPTNRFLGHSDIAPRRKQDPGHLFPWETLAKEGFGIWPDLSLSPPHPTVSSWRRPGSSNTNEDLDSRLRGNDKKEQGNDEEKASQWLEKIGYEIISPKDTLRAFQRHYQPHKIDEIPDAETEQLLQGLLKSHNMTI